MTLIGVVQSFRFDDWEYFGRSGSLVVVTGVILASLDLVTHLGNVKAFYKDILDQLVAEMRASKPRGLIAGDVDDLPDLSCGVFGY